MPQKDQSVLEIDVSACRNSRSQTVELDAKKSHFCGEWLMGAGGGDEATVAAGTDVVRRTGP